MGACALVGGPPACGLTGMGDTQFPLMASLGEAAQVAKILTRVIRSLLRIQGRGIDLVRQSYFDVADYSFSVCSSRSR